jgi:hypothetical protein
MPEEESIQKKVEKLLSLLSLQVKRNILWELLRGAVAEDEEGVKWLHAKLESFIKDEFGE